MLSPRPHLACCLATVLLAGLLAGSGSLPAQVVAKTGPGEALRVLCLTGTPSQRGEQHGRALKQEIQQLVRRWQEDLQRTYKMPPQQFIKRFVAATEFQVAIDRWTPGLLDELRGIARAAEIDFDTLYVFNLIDEVWAQGRTVVDKCTAIGVDRRGAQPTVVAQNLDIPKLYHGPRIVLRIKGDDGPEQLVTTVPGLLGANGMNSARVAVAVNSVLQLRPCKDGLPVAFVVRGLLQQEDWWQARQFLYRVKHASGQNYILGGPDVAHAFECSAGRVLRFAPFAGARHTWHTNHPRANSDWAPAFAARAAAQGKSPQQAVAPCPRYQELARRLPRGRPVELGAVLQALASKSATVPICNSSTFACTVFELGRQPRMRIRAGGAAELPFTELRFAAATRRARLKTEKAAGGDRD